MIMMIIIIGIINGREVVAICGNKNRELEHRYHTYIIRLADVHLCDHGQA